MDTPLAIVRACLTMLPRLEAEESLLASTRTGVGSGALTSGDATAITARWLRTSHGGSSRAPVVRRPDPAALGEIGIGVRIEATRG
jgi:hypothetical protein